MMASADGARKDPVEGDGKAAMIASAGDDGKEPDGDENYGKAAMIANAGDRDEKALSAASSSSLYILF
jgi:hypothetical protein